MAIRVALHHVTHYSYDRLVRLAARGALASGAALPHADQLPIRCKVTPERALPELAAGPIRQLARTAGVPAAAQPRAQGRGRPGRGPDRDQPVRLLRRGVRREGAVRVRARAAARARARTSSASPAGPRFAQLVGAPARRRGAPGPAHDRRAGRHQPAGSSARCATTSGWSRACSRPRRRSSAATARAATSPGCWSTCCASSASPRASCRATRSSSRPTRSRSRAPRA